MRLLFLLSSLLITTALAAGGDSKKPEVPRSEPLKPSKPAQLLAGSASKPPTTQGTPVKDNNALVPAAVRRANEHKDDKPGHHHHHKHQHASDDSALPGPYHRDAAFDAPDSLRISSKKKIGEMYKRAFKQSHVKLRRLKRVKNKINRGLVKLSGKEKQLHNHLARNIKRFYKFVARHTSMVHMALSIALEPILGARIVFAMDRIVGGAVIIGKGIGKFIIDHQALIVGIAVGILVSLAVTGGLTMVTMNPLLAGAIGGAAGGISATIATHLWGAVVSGNLVPTSLEEAGRRTKRVAKEAAISGAVGAVAGVISAGIGGAISGGHAAAAGAGAHAGSHGATQAAAHATTQGASVAAGEGAEVGLKLGAVNIGHTSHVVSHIVGDMGHHAVMKPVEKALEAETGVASSSLASNARPVVAAK